MIKKTVSIIIPTYNMAWSIKRAIQSCLKQTYPVLEILIVDDGSTDKTNQVVKAMARKYPQLRLISLFQNQGCAAALKVGIQAARGQWIAFLDADDELTPQSVEVRIQAASQTKLKNLGVVYGHVYVHQSKGDALIQNKLMKGNVYVYLCKELSLCQQISMLVKRSVFDRISYPTLRLPSSTDDDMVVAISRYFQFLGVDAPVARIFLHDSQTRMTNNLFDVAIGTRLLVHKYQSAILKYHGKKCLQMWRLRIVRRYIEANLQGGVVFHLEEALAKASLPEKIFLLPSFWGLKYSFKLLYAGLHWYTERYFEMHWL